MFDIDGTLVDSYGFDEECYLKAAEIVLGFKMPKDWGAYKHSTDAGILEEAIEKYNVPGDKVEIQKRFKEVFIGLISEFIESNPDRVKEIEGANCFIQYLIKQDNCRLAIATGGWEETAKLKLSAAGIDVNGCSFSSSSEFRSRVEIMASAESKTGSNVPFESRIYFGDGPWDREAAKRLNYEFILVGDRFEHENQILNFRDIRSISKIIAF